MTPLYIDIETYSEVDISAGTYRYAETAEVMLIAYAIGSGPVKVLDRTTGGPIPDDLRAMLMCKHGVRIVAHNANFDRTVLSEALGISTPLKLWECTMARALSHALPAALAALGAVLGLPPDRAKMREGRTLIQRFCKPAAKNHKQRRYTRETHPEEWERFVCYAAQDVEALREIDKRLPRWNWRAENILLWHLDQSINDRGFKVDQELVKAGAAASAVDREAAAEEFIALTGGAVTSPTQRAQFREFLNKVYGLELDNTRSETFQSLLKNAALHPDCRRLLELSVLANKTSTAKYATLASAVSRDGRFRGGLQFCGASRTRRWSGKIMQPQNLPSRGLPEQNQIDEYITALKEGAHRFIYGDEATRYASAALRGVLIAPEGGKLAVADLSNIEGRVLAWLADERWKIEAFFEFDAGRGPDLYNVTAASILGGEPKTISKADRNAFGKVPDLAFGYAGGFGACQQFAAAYGIQFTDYWKTIAENVDKNTALAAEDNYDSWGAERNPDADRSEWIASEVVKLTWRKRHPATRKLWTACAEAAISAIQHPGQIFEAGPRLKFAVKKHAGQFYLLGRLPSGNFLCYADPRIDGEGRITYGGVDSVAGRTTNHWSRLRTYGGKLVENACQSLAADILATNMRQIEGAGYRIVLTVHDEIVAEAPKGGGGAELAEYMGKAPAWLPGFPLAAAGFDCKRYRKD